MSLSKKITHLAFILDDKGEELIKVHKINPKYNSFKTDNTHQYTFNPSVSTVIVRDSWYYWSQKRYYYYNLSNPEPLLLKKEHRSILSSEELNIFIDTEVLRKLNDLAKKNWLLDLLTPTNIIIAVVICGIAYWYFGLKHGHL